MSVRNVRRQQLFLRKEARSEHSQRDSEIERDPLLSLSSLHADQSDDRLSERSGRMSQRLRSISAAVADGSSSLLSRTARSRSNSRSKDQNAAATAAGSSHAATSTLSVSPKAASAQKEAAVTAANGSPKRRMKSKVAAVAVRTTTATTAALGSLSVSVSSFLHRKLGAQRLNLIASG